MSALFEELDYCPTPSGALSLRRRYDVKLGEDVWEILLGDEFLMSSHFTASEVALGQLGVRRAKVRRSMWWSAGLGSATPLMPSLATMPWRSLLWWNSSSQ